MRGISRHLNFILACKLGVIHFLFSGYEILAKEKKIEHWLDRKKIWMAQTPQTFHKEKLLKAYSENAHVNATDESNLMELSGFSIKVINGDSSSPSSLNNANVSNADLVIVVTASESINFFTCILAKKLGAKRTIARLTNIEFIENGNKFDFSSIGVDEIISPEKIVFSFSVDKLALAM